MRAVLDPNVIISALLSPSGAPARLLRPWLYGRFELNWLADAATPARDPNEPPPIRSPDPGDDYLLALAASEQAALASGDEHLLGLAGDLLVFPPARFLRLLETAPDGAEK